MPEVFKSHELPIKIFRDGDRWCALLGENPQEGIAAFHSNPVEALGLLLKAVNYQPIVPVANDDGDTIPF